MGKSPLCDLIWFVISRNAEVMIFMNLCPLYFSFTFYPGFINNDFFVTDCFVTVDLC